MKLQIPKKVAVINSFAGYGRCSTTEALPILGAMKVQACPVPTAVFSNHTGFPSHFCVDFTSHMSAYLAQWEALGIAFDGIYCGFLGQSEQVSIAADFIRAQRKRGCSMVLIDPVMGDHGKAYRTIPTGHEKALASFVSLADIITPNITEACLLTNTPYKENGWSTEKLTQLCADLHRLGAGKVVITGLRCTDNAFLDFVSERNPASGCLQISRSITPASEVSRHGTGDIFASIVAADAVNSLPLAPSVQKAASFIRLCLDASSELNIPETDGVCFENFLDKLMA